MIRPGEMSNSSRICVARSQPASWSAGVMNFEQMSRSERAFLFIADCSWRPGACQAGPGL
jgi:hypothetical protein